MADTQNQQAPGLLANILAVAGFIILIVIIVWGAYHLLRLTGSGISSLYSRLSGGGDSIALSVPSSAVTSGKTLPISWKYTPNENGSYAFLYQCKAGFRFDITTPSGATNAVPCGNAYTVGNNTAITLTPTLTGTTTIDIPVSVVFMPSATTSKERPQGTATIRIASATAGTPTPTTGGSGTKTSTTGMTPKTPTTPTPRVVGPADLSVQILAVGIIDPMTGAFVARAPMSPNDIAAVKFDIGNNGGTATGAWYFTVQLPTNPAYTYQSPVQASLAPYGHIENTLRFRPMNTTGGVVNVMVDTGNMVRESSENNNAASLWVNGGNWTGYPYQAPIIF